MQQSNNPYWDPAVELMDREALRTLQEERLRRQLRRCFEASPLYQEKLRQVGAVPEDIRTAEDLTGLPVVTKQELRDDQRRHPPYGSFAVAAREHWREIHPSTGTTGVPVYTIWTAADVETITDFTARTLWQFGVRPRDVVQNCFAYGLWVAGMSAHYAAVRLGCLVIPSGTGVSGERQFDFLQRLKSTVLLATPSYALYLVEGLAERGHDPAALPLKLGCFGGEPGAANPPTRAKIEVGLGIDAFDYYGLAEVGPTFASECAAKAGLHFAEDHILVECLDPETQQPVPEGQIGVLVFTHLTRQGTPMLRYWSNDYARLSTGRCACGRTHLRAPGGILGRHDDLLVYKGAKFYPTQVEKVVRSFAELSNEFCIEVERERHGGRILRCTVVAEWASGAVDGTAERVLQALRAELGVTPALRLEPYATLPRTSFKAQRVLEVA